MTIRTPFENRPLRTFQLDGLYQKRKQMHTLQNIDLSIFFCVFNDLSPVRALESPPLAPDIKFDTHSRRGATNDKLRFSFQTLRSIPEACHSIPEIVSADVANNCPALSALDLTRLPGAYLKQATLRAAIQSADRTLERLRDEQAALEAAVPNVQDLSGDRFRITIDQTHHTSRPDAAAGISQWARRRSLHYARPMRDDRTHGTLGQISGFPIMARTRTELGTILLELTLDGVPGSTASSPVEKVLNDPVGLIRQLEHRTANIPDLITKTQARIAATAESRIDAERNLGAPFKHRDALSAARAELARVDAALDAVAKDDPTAAAPAPPSAAPVATPTGDDPYAPPASVSHSGPSLS